MNRLIDTITSKLQHISIWWFFICYCISLLIPIFCYMGDQQYGVWAFGSMSLIHRIIFHPLCLTTLILFCVGLCIYNRRAKAPYTISILTACKLTLLLIILFVLFNPHAFDKMPQLPYSLLFLISSICVSYGSLRWGAIYLWAPILFLTLIYRLTEYAHIQINHWNLLEVFGTTWEDAAPYFSLTNCMLLFFFILLSIGIAILMHRILRKERKSSIICTGLISGCLLVIGLFPVKNDIRMAENDIWPLGNTAWIGWESTKALVNIQRIKKITHMLPENDTHVEFNTIPDDSSVICIIHIGESVCASHLGINGYHKDTTPWLKTVNNLISYPDCVSSAPFTDRAMITILTNGRRDFLKTSDPKYLPTSPSLIDIFAQSRFKCATFWSKSNLSSGSTPVFGAIVKVLTRSSMCNYGYEENMYEQIEQIKDFVNKEGNSNKFLLIYNEGSHVPFRNYDTEQAVFLPARPAELLTDRPQDDEKVAETLTNAYDNTIHYTDSYMKNLLTSEHLKGKPVIYVYVSDHGEYLGGKDKYWLRGNAFDSDFYRYGACQVPFIIYTSPEFDELHPRFKDAIEKIRGKKDMQIAHEHIFHTILGIFGIQTQYYDGSLDLTSESVVPYSGPHPSRDGKEL